MAGIGDDHFAIGGEPDGLAGGEAFGSRQDTVQRFEDFGRASFLGAAQSAHQKRDVHGCLEALAGYVADNDQHAVEARCLHVEEIAAHFIGWAVDGVDLESGRGDFFLRDQELLHIARGGQLVGGAFLIAMNAQEAE